MAKRMKQSTCPICGTSFKFKDELSFGPYPFCSDKCRLIDLGAWLSEDYRVEESINPAMDPADFAELAQASNEYEDESAEWRQSAERDRDDDD